MDIFEYAEEYQKIRDGIQAYDIQILKLLEKRIDLAKKFIDLKEKQGNPAHAPVVEKTKIKVLSSQCKYPGLVELIWPAIMCYSRAK